MFITKHCIMYLIVGIIVNVHKLAEAAENRGKNFYSYSLIY